MSDAVGADVTNVAVADTDVPERLMEQVLVPVHAPLQPLKVWPEAGVADKVMDEPDVRLAVHVVLAAQEMADGDDETVPLPAVLTLRVVLAAGRWRYADACAAESVELVVVGDDDSSPPPQAVNDSVATRAAAMCQRCRIGFL